MDKNKRIITVLMILTIVFTIMGGTFAYWSWRTTDAEKTNITFTLASDFSCAADGGGNITSNDVSLIPTVVSDKTTANYIKREVKVTPTINTEDKTIYMNLWLDIITLDSGLSNSVNFKYAFTTSSTSNTVGVVSSGNFNGKVKDNKINLLSSKSYSENTTDTYYLWIWLDALETDTATMNQSFELSLNGSCNDTQPANAPVLDDGMIPVVISNNGVVTTVSSDNNSWYNYNNKEWANIVLVKESGTQTRAYYKANLGVIVEEDDILAYYVWIPRYSYRIWETGISSQGKEQTIEVQFENKDTISTGTQVGEYITHPAFWWDNIPDGSRDTNEELSGIWVGKFETTGTVDEPTIKGNNASLVGQNLPEQFAIAQELGETTYGVSSNVDSHMMKNSEWGAVAYLSHSKYGINEEIRINNYIRNNEELLTGCGANTVNESGSNTCEIIYGNSTQYPQSTTGNISGIFDMSGGASEYVMSCYNGIIGFAENKYYDNYTATDALTACDGGICYGHALSETTNWYEDDGYFIINGEESRYIHRGGMAFYEKSAGIFSFDSINYTMIGFRSVMVNVE